MLTFLATSSDESVTGSQPDRSTLLHEIDVTHLCKDRALAVFLSSSDAGPAIKKIAWASARYFGEVLSRRCRNTV